MQSWPLWGQFFILFCAVAAGWWLGRRSRPEPDDRREQASYGQYYRGLAYVLNDQPDDTIDAFITSLEVNPATLETHLAVGNLMRRKGEVERAIRIHQNLLSRPNLSRSQLQNAHLELARDYMSAGLLDRAERLLLDLVEDSDELKHRCLQHLMEIYQDEREWERAIAAGQRLLPRKTLLKAAPSAEPSVTRALAHYHCEQAEQVMASGDFHQARLHLKHALTQDKNCVRASLLGADIELQTEHYPQAIKWLRRVREQDPDFLPEVLEPLRRAHSALDQMPQLRAYLHESMELHPSVAVLLAIAEDIQNTQGTVEATRYMAQQLQLRPSLRGIGKLIELQRQADGGDPADSLALLENAVTELLESKPSYRCGHCGFSGRQLHWLCPGCQQWGSIKPIRGVEGD